MRVIATLLLAAAAGACGATVARVTGNEPQRSDWRSASSSDGSPAITVWTPAEDRVSFIKGGDRPVLNLRCAEGRTEAFLAFGHQVTAQPRRVQWSVDDAEPTAEVWAHTDDWRALFAAPGEPAIAFARSLVGGDRLVIHAELGIEGAKTFSFSLAGVGEALRPLAAACGWSLSG